MDFYDKPVASGIFPLLIEYNFRGSAIVSNPTGGPNGTSILRSP
jgi:hypothetical protein